MATKNLLACATTGATKYIQKAVNPKNKLDYQKLKKLFDEHQFVTNNFDDTELNLITFDWQSLERDRNWWWQLQALPFLNWYVNSLELQTEEERTRYLSVCLDAIHGWIKNAKQNKESPLVWHDHASAFRARNITNWLLFCDTAGLWLKEESRIDPFANLIIEHLDWLQEDKHYSKHTNHGFDQAMIALTISLMFARDDFELYRQCNRARLKDEVTFAFTDEGVHKENSPGYQKMMLGRLKQLRTLSPLGEQEISQMGELYIEKAEAFLRAITLPNGYLPMIGDTRGYDKGLSYKQKKELDIIDYSSSGYFIIRGLVLNKSFHLIFKACHFSHYHRHDDDLSVHLFYDGEVMLGDGGLGSHNEKDERRMFVRSSKAHNVPFFIERNSIRKVEDLNNKYPSIKVSKDIVCGISHCFGVELKREVDYSCLAEGLLKIKDSTGKDVSSHLLTNFYSLKNFFNAKEKLLLSLSDNYAISIKPRSICKITESLAYSSENFNHFLDASSFFIESVNSSENILTIDVDLNYVKKVLYDVFYRGYGPISIKEAGSWFFDEAYPSNVCHHIMSLRWLGHVKSNDIQEAILRSFVSYHKFSSNEKSKYYLGRQADHTASIRLVVLLKMMKKYKENAPLAQLLRFELVKNIDSCLKETYKENNNHGLMVDKALLQCFIEDNELIISNDNVRLVVDRIEAQLSAIFDDEGFCKEHSTSYQEYNLGIALDLLEVMIDGIGLGFDCEIDRLRRRVEKIKHSSRLSLGFLLKDNGTYITVGDSFETPKPIIINKAYGNIDPLTALSIDAKNQKWFYSKTLGVCVYKNKGLHLSLNASWHSYVHKQNDDLNFFLRINGEDIFVEGGYSDIISLNEVDTRSEFVHSTVIPCDMPWKSRSNHKSGYSYVEPPIVKENGNVLFFGSHSRVNDLLVNRKIEINEKIKEIRVDDFISVDKKCAHRFLIPENFEINIDDDFLFISSRYNSIRIKVEAGSHNFEGGWKRNGMCKAVKNNEICEHYVVEFFSMGSASFILNYK